MSLFSRSVPTTPGRALVVPASARPLGTGSENVNNLSANARVRCQVGLEPLTDEGRGEMQMVRAELHNWLRIVLYAAGTNQDIGPELPDSLEVGVLMEAGTTRIEALDVDATAAELDRYRDLARREWRETEAALAPVRQAIQLPGAAVRGARGLVGSWRDAVGELRSSAEPGQPPEPSASPEEIEQMRRTAAQQRHYFAQHPKERERNRANVQSVAPSMIDGYKAGLRAQSDLEAWLMMQEVSEILTADEVGALRREAGLI